jgi:hypothetical protein
MRRQLVHAALACICAVYLAWALRAWRKRRRLSLPETSVPASDFRARVRTGDLLLTRAGNNLMSRLHSWGLNTPVAHVGIAVVEREGDPLTRVFMFESGAPRGSQLRDLEDYMRDGADSLWWRQLSSDGSGVRSSLQSSMERHAHAAYSWRFLKDLPQELLGVVSPGGDDGVEADEHANSCADLVARVYEEAGFLALSRRRWLPMHFLDDAAMPWLTPLDKPVNVIMNDLVEIDAARQSMVGS